MSDNLFDIEHEQIILGQILLEPRNVFELIDEPVKPQYFNAVKHQYICEAINELKQLEDPIDIVTVIAKLRDNSKLKLSGGPAYVASLTNRVASSANFEIHLRYLQSLYLKRKMIEDANKTINDLTLNNLDPLEVHLQRQADLDSYGSFLNVSIDTDKTKHIERIKQRNEFNKTNKGLTGVPSGFSELDKLTGGWQKSDMIIIAARPAMGKTSLALKFALNPALNQNKPVAVFLLEVSEEQGFDKCLSIKTGYPYNAITREHLDKETMSVVNAWTKNLVDSPLYIDATPALNVYEFRSKARKLVKRHGVELIIIDYIQLMSSDIKGNREQVISDISRNIKLVAKELNVPIIALSQLSRSVELRGGDKRPMLSDLRESGAIEQDADIVGFIWRPEYYGIKDLNIDNNNFSTEGYAILDIAKHRNGALKDIEMKFKHHNTDFEDWKPVLNDFNSYEAKKKAKIEKLTEQEPTRKIKPNSDFDFENKKTIDEPPF